MGLLLSIFYTHSFMFNFFRQRLRGRLARDKKDTWSPHENTVFKFRFRLMSLMFLSFYD